MNHKPILIVVDSLDVGGCETHLLRVIPPLIEKGHNITILTFKKGGSLEKYFIKKEVDIVCPFSQFLTMGRKSLWTKLFHLMILSWQMVYYLLHNRPYIIHFFLPSSYYIGGAISVLLRIPKKIMSRRSLNYYQKKHMALIRRYELYLHQQMDVIIGNSKKVIYQLSQEESVNEQKLYLVYNGIDTKNIKHPKTYSPPNFSLNVTDNNLVMVKVANFIPYKGHKDLLEACKLLHNKNWHLLLIGGDNLNLQDELMSLCHQYKIEDNISFLGQRDDVFDILSIADIGLLTSHEEGFSNAILEYMHCSLPIIATDVGGNAEAIIHQKTGLIVPAHNPIELSKAMDILLSDNKLREKMRTLSFERVQRKFSLKHCVDQYDAIYKNLMNEH